MTRRIAMWSGPRNISTTMMRSFENRKDCAVIDEPLYAHYLKKTGANHPMRDDILQAQPVEWQEVVTKLTTDSPADIWFQKHMTHHVTDDISLEWLGKLSHFFLIRDPRLMAASYADRMGYVTPEALGLSQEAALFDYVTQMTGAAPAVIDAGDVLANPRAVLTQLCTRLEIEFDPAMLSWREGPRDSDGVWAPHWYKSVQASTGFKSGARDIPELSPKAADAADKCMPYYHKLYAHRIVI